MSGVNKVIILGNVGQDPEVKYSQNGKAICNISVATSEKWKDKQTGQVQEKSEWHRIVMFDRLAEITGEYVRKGSKVYIEGKLQTRKWQDQNGQDRYATEIVANEMQMIDSRNDGRQGQNMGQQRQQQGQQQRNNYGGQQQGQRQNYQNNGGQFQQNGGQGQYNQCQQQSMDDFDEEIPFR